MASTGWINALNFQWFRPYGKNGVWSGASELGKTNKQTKTMSAITFFWRNTNQLF